MIPKDLHIPGYEIEVMLGKGGMAAVYQARQQSFGREVALKVLNPAAEDLEDFSQRFLRESLIVARLHHSHIVQVYDVGQHDDYFYISMEYLHGGDLSNRIREGITLKESVRIIKQLADALDFAHRKNIIHRDIKPENIMFREDGAAVLTDFGIAKELESQTNLTQTGLIIGTPKYMSPEHIRGEDVDHRADIYALGIVFYRCLTNYVPFDGKDMVTTAYLQNNEPVPTLPPEVACFQEIVNRMLEKEPEDRFQRGSEIVAALDEIDRNAYKPHLTNLDVAEASKLTPPTVTRTASGRHSIKTSKPPGDTGAHRAHPAHADGTQLRARITPNPTIRADHMTPADLLLDMPLDEPPPTPRKAHWPGIVIVFLAVVGGLSFAAYHYRDELGRGAWPEVTADLRDGFERSWAKLTDITNGVGPASDDATEHSDTLPGGHLGLADETMEWPQEAPDTGIDSDATGATPEQDLLAEPWLKSSESLVEEEAIPEQPAEPDISEIIAGLLSEAEEHLANRRLRRPVEDNAYVKFQQVLELEADNPQALAGLTQIAAAYFTMAERAIATEQFDAVPGFLAEARVVAPTSAELPRLERRLAAAIAEQKEREIQAAAAARAAQIEELLVAAKSHERAGRIRAPVGNNALEKYQQILDLDPDNAEAIRKLIEYGR